uniref:Reverse transcriptase domain-containing protein n=1 Tax=Amphimedon queenslandica TaxID=400682 RepID=A0A1X7T764_AMPQE
MSESHLKLNVRLISLWNFFDVKKVFESVSHSILLSKLQSLGIPSHILHWLFSYISDWSQCVCVGNAISPPSSVSSSVPQGSILGHYFC